MFTLAKWILQTAFFLILFTVVGQMRVGPESLENRYHRLVNSDGFQSFFWTSVRPVTWTWERARDLARNRRALERAADTAVPADALPAR